MSGLEEFIVEEIVIKACVAGISGCCAVVDNSETCPVAGGEAHRAGLATGVELTIDEREIADSFCGGTNSINLSVSRGVVRCGNCVDAFSDDFSIAHDDSGKRPATPEVTFCVASSIAWRRNAGFGLRLSVSAGGSSGDIFDLLFPSETARVSNSRINQSMTQTIRSTRVMMPEGIRAACLHIVGERIREVRAWENVPAGIALHDYGDLVVLPGLVDSHVHINEPGRTDWEGFATATRAAASGGVTTLVDMPLNCLPETIHVQALEAKRSAAAQQTWVDWAAWGGVVRGNSKELLPLVNAGVPGFKCFLIHSGIETFQWVDESELRAALNELRGCGLPLLAHAELSAPVAHAAAKLNGADWRAYSTYLASRPDEVEVDAIRLLIQLAEEFDAWVHVVHLSSANALPLLRDSKSRGVRVSVETCPHYLWFTPEEIQDGATEYKCTPPIRSAENRELLWNALAEELIDFVATDHSPCPPAMKKSAKFGKFTEAEEGRWDKAWGGFVAEW